MAEAATPADMQKPMYMLLNLAVGDTGSWPGKYDPSLPTGHMLVDYVRVWQTGTVPPPPAFTLVTGPGDVAAVGGSYALKPDGLSDLYDFGKARAGVHFDGTNLPIKLAHTVWGSPFGDEIRAGAGTLNFAAGAGDDVFIFGRGTSRVMGGAGNDSFVLTKGAIGVSDQIIDFHRSLPGGGEHDLLRLDGFSAAAHLDYKSGSGALQFYAVVDGAYTSPLLAITIANGTGQLAAQDYVFTHA